MIWTFSDELYIPTNSSAPIWFKFKHKDYYSFYKGQTKIKQINQINIANYFFEA